MKALHAHFEESTTGTIPLCHSAYHSVTYNYSPFILSRALVQIGQCRKYFKKSINFLCEKNIKNKLQIFLIDVRECRLTSQMFVGE